MKTRYVRDHNAIFDSRYRIDDAGCWLWTGAISDTGYGSIRIKGKVWAAHRYSYERTKGKIPNGLFLDHSCHTRSCVNPAHLAPVTNKQNLENRSGANKNSLSGIRGVSYDARRGQWYARVHSGGTVHRSYGHPTAASAGMAASEMRRRYFTNSLMDA